jgi:hypothetical protein
VISLLPALEHLTFIAIHQAGAVPTLLGLRIAAVSEPLSNGSVAHANLQGNIAGPQTLTMKGEDLFVALLPLGGSRQACLFLSPRSIGSALLERPGQRSLLLPLRSVCSSLLGSAPG